MKKKMIFAAIAVVAATGYFIHHSLMPKNNLNALSLANIEAISEEEQHDGWTRTIDTRKWSSHYGTYTRHFIQTIENCNDGGTLKDCTPNEWISFYDEKN